MTAERRRAALLALSVLVWPGGRAHAQVARAAGAATMAPPVAAAVGTLSLAPISAPAAVSGPAASIALSAPSALAAAPLPAPALAAGPAALTAAPAAAAPAAAAPLTRAATPRKDDPLGLAFDALFDGGRSGAHEELVLDAPDIRVDKQGGFVVPNERHPKDMKPILDELPSGAYVTVGTERGFLAAAMAPQVTHLVLLDIDPAVTAYDRTNVALLRLARDRREYVELRRAGTKRWAALARERAPELEALLGDEGNAKQWRKYQTRNLSDSAWSRGRDAAYRFLRDRLGWKGQLTPPGEEGRMPEFEGTNYLRDDAQFARVKALADAGRIRTARLDLGNEDAVRAVTGALAASGTPLAALDLSNVWESVYLKARPVMRIVEAFAGVASPDSLLIASEGGGAVVGYTGPSPWKYYGFRFGDLAGGAESAVRAVFGYTFRLYTPNAVNVPALPDDRPSKPTHDHERRPTYWWTDSTIETR